MPVGWTHSYPGVLRKALTRRLKRRHWSVSSTVARAMDLPPLPRRNRVVGQVWAVFLVKNEADIIGHTVRHALDQGVDRVLVVDNGSTDGTLELVRELADGRPVVLGHDREPAYWQSVKMTYLARWAAARGADWVVPMDADEFWFARGQSVAEYLRSTSHDIVEATLNNLFPIPENPDADGLSATLRFDHAPHIHGKTALRAHPLMWLGMGNHVGIRPGTTGEGLHIAHLPWRSEQQYVRKVRQGAAALAATDLATNLGGHWRRLGMSAEDVLAQEWADLLRGIPDERDGWNPRGPFSFVQAGGWPTWTPPPAPENTHVLSPSRMQKDQEEGS